MSHLGYSCRLFLPAPRGKHEVHVIDKQWWTTLRYSINILHRHKRTSVKMCSKSTTNKQRIDNFLSQMLCLRTKQRRPETLQLWHQGGPPFSPVQETPSRYHAAHLSTGWKRQKLPIASCTTDVRNISIINASILVWLIDFVSWTEFSSMQQLKWSFDDNSEDFHLLYKERMRQIRYKWDWFLPKWLSS